MGKTLILLLAMAAQAMAGDAGTVRRVMEDSKSLEGVPFADVVEAVSGCQVIPVDAENDKVWLNTLGTTLDDVLRSLNDPAHPSQKGGRINEASRFIENELLFKLNAIPSWKCTIPRTVAGTEQRSGYPDLRLELPDGRIVYLDPKLHAEDNRTSSFRTFYFEPKTETLKIQDSAVHLLVGVSHAPSPSGGIRFQGWELVDISSMPVRLKAEFQSSNREIYREKAVVGRSRPSPE